MLCAHAANHACYSVYISVRAAQRRASSHRQAPRNCAHESPSPCVPSVLQGWLVLLDAIDRFSQCSDSIDLNKLLPVPNHRELGVDNRDGDAAMDVWTDPIAH